MAKQDAAVTALPPSAPVRVAALYRFATIADPEAVREQLDALCRPDVRGTLLVAHEGLNGTIAGPGASIDRVLAGIRALPGFAGLDVKFATAAGMPFHRLKVRIKPEIVTMGQPDLDPAVNAGTYVAPADWNALIQDPDVIVIDTRNDYEAAVGAFAGAIQPNTRGFRDFPDWFRTEGRALLDGPTPPRVAMYCTGGIRCEKATAFLKAEGVQDVFHLEGGILRYLETTPEADSLWRGECFVFDERVAVGHGLTPGSHSLCRGCRMPVSPEGRTSPRYIEGVCCDRCADDRSDGQKARYGERARQMEIAARLGIDHVGAVLPDPIRD
ncbi:MAG: rhodanese-related sulfurtransferase [Alphaproteobacteria bacterium]|nr:rhodanese-related sulfurtransferase [Alphaproteobacteria bacterium]MBU2041853.1 rhodanese-related sulfurtransferase [Alphaproteobacteria bacterium]MBU2127183.1 rhodanese-related sulfurtransferase [Alphaproteobacteria bacterium]MBU2209143.1 rhodanese-related sulfurtransferase [Alphaproteobacteria bacterium]MBU2290123.1 rhodanese-related sulfurtransferase [Alphaproteobacteria bacterium]